ncbi:hypothetical protein GF345_00095 [Candidatus Woesearchaeota archaeon]|nr:hypothetical protein [Candidatus Woesearchaeota archaeon]
MRSNILKEIKNRKSPAVFKTKDVEKKKLDAVIEAARWAPSCFNNQAWNYVFVHKKDKTRKSLEKSLTPGNGWARKAPYIAAVGADPKKDCKTNGLPYYAYDAGLSVMNLSIEAEHQGLSVHQMAGFSEKKVRKAIGFSKDHRVIVVFALGYDSDPKSVWDKLSSRIKDRIVQPRQRKPVDDNFFFGKFEA